MKYLLLLALALGLLWWWRLVSRKSRSEDRDRKTPEAEIAPPQDMIACLHCGLHLPRGEAVTGRRGLYCCPAHQRADEGAHSP